MSAAVESGWIVRLTATELSPGHRFVFAEEFGGEGEILTVESQVCLFGLVEVWTEEIDFPINFLRGQMVTLAEQRIDPCK